MILNIDDLKKSAIGYEGIAQTEKGFEFYRFNAEEQKLYESSPISQRTFSPAGIELLFKSDAKGIYIELEAEICADRSFFCVDIFENGELVGSLKNFDEEKMVGFYSWTDYPVGIFDTSVEFGDGEKEIRIVLPWSVRCYFKKIELKDATYIEPIKHKKNILMYGDSITHGYDSIHPSNSYAMRLAKKLDANCYMKAVGGEVYWPELAKIKQTRDFDYVTVAYGANDWGTTKKEEFDKNSQEFLKAISENYKNINVFIISPIWRKDHTTPGLGFGEPFRYVHERLEKLCENYDNLIYVDGWDLVPEDENLYGDLRLHPNDDGFNLYFENLYEKIKEYL